MSNATDNRNWAGDGAHATSAPKVYDHKIGANVEVFAGTLAAVLLSDADLPVVPLALDGTTEIRGINAQHVNNLGGQKGDQRARVICETGVFDNAAGGDALAAAHLLRPVYASDDHTLANNPGTNRPCAGALVGFDSATGNPVALIDPLVARFMQMLFNTAPQVVAFSATPAFSLSKSQQLTMTGNITGWTIPNGSGDQEIDLYFVQDGTGSRTLAGTPANVRLAGNTLTLSTGAGKVDHVRLKWNGSLATPAYVETCRAMNC